MLRLAGYYRVSTEAQDSNYSIPTQKEACHNYCARNGHEIVAEFEENYSGMKLDRPKLNIMMKMAQEGLIDGIVCFSTDRFSREPKHALILFDDIKKYGIQLHFVQDGIYDPTKSDDEIIWLMKFGFNKVWYNKFSEAARRGQKAKIAEGMPLGTGTAPFGYDTVHEKQGPRRKITRYEINEEQAEIVRRIYHMYVGGYSTVEIVETLNRERIPSPAEFLGRAKKRKGWSYLSVLTILKDESYAGVWYANRYEKVDGKTRRTTRDKWIPIPVPEIVSRETWEEAQKKISESRKKSRRNTKKEYLMQGRIKCSCGYHASASTHHISNGTRYGYYHCNTRTGGHQHVNKCDTPYFRSTYVDFTVWSFVIALFENETILNFGAQESHPVQQEIKKKLTERLESIETRIETFEEQKSMLLKLYLNRTISEKELLKERGELDAVLNDLYEAREEIKTRLTVQNVREESLARRRKQLNELRQPGANLRKYPFEMKRRYIELLNIRAILVVRDGKKQLDIVWEDRTTTVPLMVPKEDNLSIDYGTSSSTIVNEQTPTYPHTPQIVAIFETSRPVHAITFRVPLLVEMTD